jgi:hypothetical protein
MAYKINLAPCNGTANDISIKKAFFSMASMTVVKTLWFLEYSLLDISSMAK